MDSAEGHFSLAMMLREGKGGIVNVPLAIVHLARASSLGMIRAINFLAHGLYDHESWLAQYGREQQLLLLKQQNSSYYSGKSINSKLDITEINNKTAVNATNISKSTESLKSTSNLIYDSNKPIIVYLPNNEIIEIPIMFDSLLNQNIRCESALSLLKYLSEYTSQSNFIQDNGLADYLDNEWLLALDSYEEGAELGILSAQLNSLILYKHFIRYFCITNNENEKLLKNTKFKKYWFYDIIESKFDETIDWNYNYLLPLNQTNQQNESKIPMKRPNFFDSFHNNKQCLQYFNKMTEKRLKQLINNNYYEAYNQYASMIKMKNDRNNNLNELINIYFLGSVKGNTESINNLAWIYYYNQYNTTSTSTSTITNTNKAANSTFIAIKLFHYLIYNQQFMSINYVIGNIALLYIYLNDFYHSINNNNNLYNQIITKIYINYYYIKLIIEYFQFENLLLLFLVTMLGSFVYLWIKRREIRRNRQIRNTISPNDI